MSALGTSALGTSALGTSALGTSALGTSALGTSALGTSALGTSALAAAAVGGVARGSHGWSNGVSARLATGLRSLRAGAVKDVPLAGVGAAAVSAEGTGSALAASGLATAVVGGGALVVAPVGSPGFDAGLAVRPARELLEVTVSCPVASGGVSEAVADDPAGTSFAATSAPPARRSASGVIAIKPAPAGGSGDRAGPAASSSAERD